MGDQNGTIVAGKSEKRENFESLGVVKEINEKWMNWILYCTE